MNWWHAVIYGIVEGLTEFLPVSSTGHLILSARALGQSHDNFLSSFSIAIQSGAIVAVVIFYGKTLLRDVDVLKKVLAAFIPTAIIGAIFYKIVKNILLTNDNIVVWSLLVGGIFLIIFELCYKEKETNINSVRNITYRQAIAIGIFQSFAMIPGLSRSAATIVGGLFLGLKRKTIVEFSFLLAVPTMFAATGFDLLKSSSSFSLDQIIFLALGFFVSFAVALMSIKFLLFYVKKYNFISFGIYRIIIAVAAMFFLI